MASQCALEDIRGSPKEFSCTRRSCEGHKKERIKSLGEEQSTQKCGKCGATGHYCKTYKNRITLHSNSEMIGRLTLKRCYHVPRDKDVILPSCSSSEEWRCAKASLRVSVFAPTMNFLLTPDKGKEEKHVGVQCLYCKKVFKNHQALGGHLSAHQEEINSKRSWNYPSHFSNSVSITNNSPQPFSMRHPEIFSGGPLFSEVTPPLDFSKRLYSNENSWVNISRFYENNTSAMPPKCSSSSGHAEIQNSKPLSFIAPAPSVSMVPISVPLDPPFCLVSNGVCQFNTDQFRSFRDGMPSFSANAMPCFQDHNCVMIPYPVNAVTDLHPDLSSKQSLCFKEPITIGSLPPDPSESSGQGEIGRYKTQTVSTSKGRKKHCIGGAGGSADEIMNPSKKPKKNSELLMETDKPPHPSQSSDQGEIGQYETQILLTSKGGKRHCLGEAGGSAEMMNCQWKRPKINSELSMETDKPPKRELLLFKDVENCFSRAGISSNAGEEEGQMDLDLSLHL